MKASRVRRRPNPLARRLAALAAALLGLLPCRPAFSHTRSVSYATFVVDAGASGALVRARLSWIDAGVLEAAGHRRDGGALLRHIAAAVKLETDQGPCAPDRPPRELTPEEGWLDVEWHVGCPPGQLARASSDLLFEENPTHLQMVRVLRASETSVHVLDAGARSAPLSRASEASAGVSRFIRMGVEHIASGSDHLLFVAVLVLGSARIRRTALVITGFSAGHAVTLSLAVLGVVTPRESPVEALIGLSIALVALENGWLPHRRRDRVSPRIAVALVLAVAAVAALSSRKGALSFAGVALFAASTFAWQRRARRPEDLRVLVAALFGLVHGLGFAQALSSLRLSKADLAAGLFGFNLGVEIGQLAFVALLTPLVALVRLTPARSAFVRWASAAALGLGVYWFVSRALG